MTELIYVSAGATKCLLPALSFMDSSGKVFDPKDLVGKTVTVSQADDESVILAFDKPEVKRRKPVIIDYPEDRERLKEEFGKIADRPGFKKSVEKAKTILKRK